MMKPQRRPGFAVALLAAVLAAASCAHAPSLSPTDPPRAPAPPSNALPCMLPTQCPNSLVAAGLPAHAPADSVT